MQKLMLKILFAAIICLSVVTAGFLLSKNSIPNQEGYFEEAWKFSHLDFNSSLLSPSVTPINFLVATLLERSFSISLSNSWKLMDLFFCGLLVVFFTKVYRQTQNSNSEITFLPLIICLTSLGFIYSFTSTSGEGMPIFFSVLGVNYWQKRSFVLASLLFILSFLSKYTFYLIAPGVILWTILNVKTFTKKDFQRIIISASLLFCILLLYHGLKSWGDLKLQLRYVSNYSPYIIGNNVALYLFAIVLGAPIIVLFSIFNPQIKNIYWLVSLSSFLVLSRRYFYWNHVQQIISFLIMFFLSNSKAREFLKLKYLGLQLLLFISLFLFLPITAGNNVLFPKHITISESRAIDTEIQKDYHGGKIGYYLNRRFDEPFPHYEISYLEPTWDFIIEDTEYVVLPLPGIPRQLQYFKKCRYIFYQTVITNSIYKVECQKK